MQAMKPSHENVLADALALPQTDRAALIGDLIDSLDEVADEDADAAWDAEIARRVADLDAGRAQTLSWHEVREQLRAVARGKSI